MAQTNEVNFADSQVLQWEPRNLLGTLSFKELMFSNDYQVIAIKGILTSLVMLGLAGLFALTFRAELTVPDIQFFGAKVYMTLMTLHGMLMVFGFVIPLTIAVCYFLMPKLLKTEGLLWADAAQWSYWILIAAAVLLIIGRPDFTWTFYAPMSLRVGGDLVWMGYVAIFLVGVSEFLAGVVLLRNALAWKGGLRTMPLMGWAMMTVGAMLIISTPALSLVGTLLLTDWLAVTAVFDPAAGGSVKTFLWLFWFYGHPAVYLPFVPAIGILYSLLPRFLGRPMWSHMSAIIAFASLFLLSFVVFHHHFQPAVTIHSWVQRAFQILTLLIFIPSTLHVFNWIASLWQDRIPDSARRAVPFKFMIGAIFFVIYGGVTAFINAQISIDSGFIHNTYWIPAHFHAMFLGFCAQIAFAGVYFVYPYIAGRRYNQTLANIHFWFWQIGIFGKVTMMFLLGLAFFPRWVVDYQPIPLWVTPQIVLSVSAYLIGLGFLAFVVNMALSLRKSERISGDPWPVEDEIHLPAGAPEPAE